MVDSSAYETMNEDDIELLMNPYHADVSSVAHLNICTSSYAILNEKVCDLSTILIITE